MAASLVTQVSQDTDPAKQAELAKLQADLLAKKKKEAAAAAGAQPAADRESKDKDDDQPHGGCCWRIFCGCFARRPKQQRLKSASVPSGGPPDSSSTASAQPVTPTTVSEPTGDGGPKQKFLMPPLPADQKGKKL